MKRGFKTWAEQQAIRYRQILGLPPEARLPAVCLAAHLGIAIVRPDQIPGMTPALLNRLLRIDPESWSAFTLPCETGTFIIYNTSHSLARQESDLMHEIAHLICRHEPATVVCLPGLSLPLRTYNPGQEEEARWLGTCLQLPRDGLWRVLRRGMDGPLITLHFGASADLVRYRRQVTGIDRQLKRLRSLG